MGNKVLIGSILAIVLALGFFAFFNKAGDATPTGAATSDLFTVYKSSSCGCCSVYLKYAKDKLNLNVISKEVEDLSAMKNKFNIPEKLRSCHTSVVGNYFVEGHIPVEAINKLLAEKPDIAGIAMPGMPSGSPGMPGKKNGPFIIYGVKKDGTYDVFMTL